MIPNPCPVATGQRPSANRTVSIRARCLPSSASFVLHCRYPLQDGSRPGAGLGRTPGERFRPTPPDRAGLYVLPFPDPCSLIPDPASRARRKLVDHSSNPRRLPRRIRCKANESRRIRTSSVGGRVHPEGAGWGAGHSRPPDAIIRPLGGYVGKPPRARNEASSKLRRNLVEIRSVAISRVMSALCDC